MRLAPLVLVLAGCGSDLAPGEVPEAEAVMARGLTRLGAPVQPLDDNVYGMHDPMFLSVRIDGRPSHGAVEATWTYRNEVINQAWIDLANVNGDVMYSSGVDSYAGFHLAPTAPWPVGPGYRVDTTFDGAPLTSTEFAVAPPPGALPSTIRKARLAAGMRGDYEPVGATDVFRPNQQVHIVGRADFGVASWLEVKFVVAGKPAPECTQTAALSENMEDTGFSFTCLPYRGWPKGTHEVHVVLDGVLSRYVFYVQ